MRNYLLLATVLLAFACSEKKHGDAVILGGTIYTADDAQPKVEAVVVKGDKISNTEDVELFYVFSSVVQNVFKRIMMMGSRYPVPSLATPQSVLSNIRNSW